MKSVKDDQVPTAPEEREKYFMSQVEKGEQLCAKGVPTLPGCTGSPFTYRAVKGPTLLLRLHWRSLGPFGFIPHRSS
jgi:mitochondrial import receptor subunit TOM20